MAKLKIYGTPTSRTSRVLWTALELGIEFDFIRVDHREGDTQKPEYLKLNPNARVPTIDDDGFVLWESLAITTYLAKMHGGALAPQGAKEEASMQQWTNFAINYFDIPAAALLWDARKPEIEREAGLHERMRGELDPFLKVLDDHLADHEYFVGDRFTVADINVVGALIPVPASGFDISMFPNLQRWLKACMGRTKFAEVNQVEAIAGV
jgi:glutathione S-transferase